MLRLLSLSFFVGFFALFSCKTARRSQAPAVETGTSLGAPSRVESSHLREEVLERQNGTKVHVTYLDFTTDARISHVQYRLCQEKNPARCVEGVALSSGALLCNVQAGNYLVSTRACSAAPNGSETCGEEYLAPAPVTVREEAIAGSEALCALEQRIGTLSAGLYGNLSKASVAPSSPMAPMLGILHATNQKTFVARVSTHILDTEQEVQLEARASPPLPATGLNLSGVEASDRAEAAVFVDYSEVLAKINAQTNSLQRKLLNSDLIPAPEELVRLWTRTQEKTLTQQFIQSGVRFFDIRLADVRKPGFNHMIGFSHGSVYFGDEITNLKSVLHQVSTLLRNAPDQFIILDFSNGTSSFSQKNLDFFINSLRELEPFLPTKVDDSFWETPLQDRVAHGERAFVIIEDTWKTWLRQDRRANGVEQRLLAEKSVNTYFHEGQGKNSAAALEVELNREFLPRFNVRSLNLVQFILGVEQSWFSEQVDASTIARRVLSGKQGAFGLKVWSQERKFEQSAADWISAKITSFPDKNVVVFADFVDVVAARVKKRVQLQRRGSLVLGSHDTMTYLLDYSVSRKNTTALIFSSLFLAGGVAGLASLYAAEVRDSVKPKKYSTDIKEAKLRKYGYPAGAVASVIGAVGVWSFGLGPLLGLTSENAFADGSSLEEQLEALRDVLALKRRYLEGFVH